VSVPSAKGLSRRWPWTSHRRPPEGLRAARRRASGHGFRFAPLHLVVARHRARGPPSGHLQSGRREEIRIETSEREIKGAGGGGGEVI
jgi:hypothetical protein